MVLILERDEGGERGMSVWERNIDQLLPVHTLTGDQTHNNPECALPTNQTHNLLVYGMMLQPTEPPSQGSVGPFSV